MAFEDLKENTESIQEQVVSYVENTVAYYKLRGFKLAMKSTTTVIKLLLILFSFAIVLFFCSIGGALAIGLFFNSYPLGFLSVGCFYVIVTVILFLLKDKIVEGPIVQIFSEIFFND